jgi:hypothetical protein
MIEAMACGTPVIAKARGSVPEIIEDGITGFVVNDLDGAVKAVKKISTLKREKCRQVFEERFTASRMASAYTDLYERLIYSSERQNAKAVSKPAKTPAPLCAAEHPNSPSELKARKQALSPQ